MQQKRRKKKAFLTFKSNMKLKEIRDNFKFSYQRFIDKSVANSIKHIFVQNKLESESLRTLSRRTSFVGELKLHETLVENWGPVF